MRLLALFAIASTVAACSGESGSSVDQDAAPQDDTFVAETAEDGEPADVASDVAIDTRPEVTPDADPAAAKLLEALGDSVWQATATRTEKGLSKTRAYELRFQASTLQWAEIRNPYGPARLRTLRVFSVDADGKTVRSTILSPSGWPIHPDNGKKETWTFEVVSGSPRKLRLTKDGVTETFTEGPWPKPTTGLTAFVNVFSATGAINASFCGTGVWSSINRQALWEFARGNSTEKPTGSDVVAGAQLLTWVDTSSGDNFAVTDVDGFRDLGGTELSDQANFIVRYLGVLKHPGGAFRMREADDDVKDAIWAFVGGSVGSTSVSNIFLEVHGKVAADSTPDEPATTFSAGDVPVEVLVLRCASKIQQIDVQVSMGSTVSWKLVGATASTPRINDTIFPPAL